MADNDSTYEKIKKILYIFERIFKLLFKIIILIVFILTPIYFYELFPTPVVIDDTLLWTRFLTIGVRGIVIIALIWAIIKIILTED